MHVVRKVALAALMVATSVAAQAATYLVELTGTVSSQVNPGADPDIAIGDTVKMTGRFSDERIFDNGSNRFAVVYGLPTSGQEFWNVKLNDLTWKSADEFQDGAPFDFDPDGRPLSYPYFELLSGGKIGAPQGLLIPSNTDRVPSFDLGAGHIRSGDPFYNNTRETPGFDISWDLSGAKLVQVPEPSIWAMTIIGFGLVGAATRKRARTLRRITC